MVLDLRQRFEERVGTVDDGQYRYILSLALDDQKQYIKLSDKQWKAVEDPARFPTCSSETERLDEIRERLLEAMEIISDIVARRNI